MTVAVEPGLREHPAAVQGTSYPRRQGAAPEALRHARPTPAGHARNSRLVYDFGTQVERGAVSFTTDDITLTNLTGDNNEFIQMFDQGDKWSCNRAVTFRVYGDVNADSWGDTKLKTWDNTSGLYSESRGGVQDWDGNPHTWTITWDTSQATLSRDGVEIVWLDVAGQDLRVGTLWLPLNTWDYGYSHPIGSIYSNLSVDAWEPDDGPGDDPVDHPVPDDGGRAPIEDAGVLESGGATVYGGTTDLPLEGSFEMSYLLFDLTDLPGVVTAATLTLHAQSDSHADGDGGTVYAVADTSWSEDSLSWANRPALGAALDSFGAVAADDTVSVDVTDGTVAGSFVAFAIGNGGSNGAHFWSKEGTATPSLRVTVVPASEDSGGTAAEGGDETEPEVDDPGGEAPGDEGGTGPIREHEVFADEDDEEELDPRTLGCGCASVDGGSVGLLGLVALLRRRRGT